MPYCSIETNQTLDPADHAGLLQKTSALVAGLLGKPESYVMVSIRPKARLVFAGNGQPAAFVQLKSIGLPGDRCAELSGSICSFMEKELGVPRERVFIEFKDLERHLFGWNGKTL